MANQKVDFDVLAHDKASDKLDRIARAFKNLSRESDGVKRSDGLDELSRKLKKVADDFEREGNRSGKRFGSGLKKWLTGSGANLGKEGGTVFGSGFLGALKTPVLGPALIAVLGGAVATAAPAVGAIAGAGLVAGFGAGLATLGIVFAAKSDAVKAEWKRTLDDMGSQMRVLSAPFEKTLLSMAAVAKRTFAGFAPELRDAFKMIAPELSAFGDQLGRAFEQLAPAVKPLAEAFSGVLRSLGPATQSAIGNISKGLQELADSVKANPDALADLVRGVGDLTRILLAGIGVLNDINGAFERLTGGISLVDVVMRGLELPLVMLLGPFVALQKGMEAVGLKAKEMNHEVTISAETAKLWTQGLTAAQAAAVGTGAAIDPLKTKVESLATKFERQWQATQKANEALVRMQNLALGLSGAQINFQAAIDAATESVKSNGRTLDLNTEKGRANRTALNNLAQTANEQTVAMRNAGDGNVAAARHAEGARANFVRLAQQMGATKPQAEAMARSMIAIPNVSRTAKLQANKKDLEKKLAEAKAELANPNLTKARTAALKADIRKLEQGIANAKAALAGVPGSKTVTITTRLVTERIARNVSGASGGRVPTERRALGGPVTAGTPYLVGENGPEVVVPDSNGTVFPNGGTGRAGALPGGTPIIINVNGALDPNAVAQQIQQMLLRFKRLGGGRELGIA